MYQWLASLFFLSRYHYGTNSSISFGVEFFISSFVKSNNGGSGFPFGSFVVLSLNSSKNGCYSAYIGVSLLSGL